MKQNYNQIDVKDNMKVETEQEVVETAKEKKEPMQRLVEVQPKKIKRNLLSRLVTGVLGPEGLPGIGTYVNEEIIKPALKNIIYEGIESAVRMAIFRDGGGPNRGHSSYGNNSRRATNYRPATNYNSNYRGSNNVQHSQPERVVRGSRYGVEEYVIADRFEAANILTSITEYADRYDKVSVADYYEAIGVDFEYTDNNYGWTIGTIVDATIVPVRGGYTIKFPPVEVI